MEMQNVKLWTAIVTPLMENLAVDYPTFDILLKRQEKAGLGVVVLGSTGEAMGLPLEERKKIVEFVSKLKLNIPIVVGVGGVDLEQNLEWMDYCRNLNIQGFLVVTPIYTKPGLMGQFNWFRAHLDRAKLPCILYNVPGRTAVKFHFEAAKKLQDHPQFFGLKEASGSTDDFKYYREILPKQILFSGDDALMPEFAALGGQGLISVASNIWPEKTLKFVELCLEKKLSDESKKLWVDACNELFVASNPNPVKYLMWKKALIKTPFLRAPLNHQDMPEKHLLEELDKKIEKWTE